jgi:uncharacterized protein DUF6221
MGNDLIAFLNARIGEDEAGAARLAEHLARGGAFSSSGPMSGNSVTINTAWLPDRVLREVAAKRVIMAAHGPDELNRFGSVQSPLCLVCITDREGYEELWEADKWPCLPLRALAAVYSNHPDYRPEWALSEAVNAP